LDITQQLEQGIRFLDIRMDDAGDCHHGGYKTGQSIREVFGYVTDFLKQNLSEFVIMRLQFENGDLSYFQNLISTYEKSILNYDKIPTVRQVRGKIWIIYDKFTKTPENAMTWNNSLLTIEDNYYSVDIDVKEAKQTSIENFFNYYQIKKYETFKDNLFLWHFSASGVLTLQLSNDPQEVAYVVNESALKYMYYPLGVLIFDFPSQSLIQSVLNSNPTYPIKDGIYRIGFGNIPHTCLKIEGTELASSCGPLASKFSLHFTKAKKMDNQYLVISTGNYYLKGIEKSENNVNFQVVKKAPSNIQEATSYHWQIKSAKDNLGVYLVSRNHPENAEENVWFFLPVN